MEKNLFSYFLPTMPDEIGNIFNSEQKEIVLHLPYITDDYGIPEFNTCNIDSQESTKKFIEKIRGLLIAQAPSLVEATIEVKKIDKLNQKITLVINLLKR